ncbi:MAG: hypothetical protein MJZ34_13365 [Paludibacteraceae bacterium]|nr:hypothetical protein [Paludibacteraceae bacterium]
MEFEVKRKVKKEVEETVVVDLQKYYSLRVIRDMGSDKKCVYEEEFIGYIPDEQDIAEAIMKTKDKYNTNVKLFVSINENYRFVEKEWQ